MNAPVLPLTLKNGLDQKDGSASLTASSKPAELQFERPDWTLFRSLGTLAQKAGVSVDLLPKLVLKELVDNALDAGANVKVGPLSGDSRSGYFVQDDGPGIDGGPAEIARLFSLGRPLVSSKLLRLPSRGAMGNGLRVVVGAIAASGGKLQVLTRNQRHVLTPRDDGTTAIETTDEDFSIGTAICVEFGPALLDCYGVLEWAHQAILLASGGQGYAGRTSPHWYDDASFFELVQAAGARPVRDLIANIDGCTGAKAGQIAADYKNTPCSGLTRAAAAALLLRAREHAKHVRPERLGFVGPLDALPAAYAKWTGYASMGAEPRVEIPVVVEAWARARSDASDSAKLSAYVNRTPITGEVHAYKTKKEITLRGCGLAHRFATPNGSYEIHINVTTPYCPITSDGKAPDLKLFSSPIAEVIQKACRRARRDTPEPDKSEVRTQKTVIVAHLAEGIAKASGDGAYRFSQRQLFYAVRPFVIDELEVEPSWGNFEGIITGYEEEHGDIAGMYRDPRGTLYHPHTGEDIPLGTLAVEQYGRPAWTFNKVLYIEKEGFFEALKAAKWPERHDCALMTSKGFSSRAARDLLDLLADTDEPLSVFCVHDADAAGTMIYQTLQEATKARQRRRVEIINLGLEPWEAVDLDLQVEDVKGRERRAPVAEYVAKDTPDEDEEDWAEWLQGHRVELNAMTTPQFIEWLDAKMEENGGEKVVPPAEVVFEDVRERLSGQLRQAITERILREAGIDDQVVLALTAISIPSPDTLLVQVGESLAEEPELHWTDCAYDIAHELARSGDAR